MREPTRNYIIDVGMLIVALLLAISALLLWVVFPRGYFPARVLWVEIHKWSGLALTVLVMLHLVLHWPWLWTMTRQYLVRSSKGTSARRRVEDRLPSSE
jgi:hypothetical protein